ncbi:hypothetical protein DCC39_18185 [Pueribacillus theae]|uniref:CTP synthase n=1 Tax=Pueribacillus theae TaxID=2171751 RepID=A0A2U1JJV9_9BACI|nr:DUF6241 domain-containing protein [Pueribacillus theae]PWA05295.1 hypothetical protein DCC39_18185 [Pueribacillus theae]
MRSGNMILTLTTIVLVVLVALAMLYMFGWLSWFSDETGTEEKGDPVAVEKTAGHEHKDMDNGNQNKDKEPVEGVIKADRIWTESSIMRTLHEMTHQKIKADEKWGAVAMTKENIETMIKVVEDHKKDLDHYDLYMGILNDWKVGNFSRADKQHNKLWKLERGNVGKAKGLLSKEEEQEYIKAHFDDGVGTFEW